MENTIESAEAFMVENLNIKSFIAKTTISQEFIKCMVAYAASISQTQLKQRQSTRTAIAEALDREAETRPPDRNRIVVPKNAQTKERMIKEYGLVDEREANKVYKSIIEYIRTLNPGAEVVEAI